VIEKFHGLGCTRGFIKNAIKYIPICGWFFGFAEHVFLQRSFEQDRKVIEQRIAEYMTYPNATWIVVTAEGTRFTKEKHETSIKFASEKKVEPLKHHLIPRARGFATCVPLLKKYDCPMIYNVQLAFDKDSPVSPTLGNLLLGKKVVAHLYIERIPMQKAEPTFEFLYDVYREKDRLQESFHQHGNFYEGRGLKPVEGVRMKPRLRVLINTVIWILFSVLLMTYYTIKLIVAGRYWLLSTVGLGVIALRECAHET
jgi:lysophosphatidic acid acyltransferase/lysophosphatidylinositol acyltransferase